MMTWKILQGDARERLAALPDASVQCCVTSPPYFGLRDYGHDGQIGLEPTPAAYVSALVAVFDEVWRVLRDDGVLWLNLGDTYAGARGQASRGGPPSASSTLQGNGHRGGGPKLRQMTSSRRRDDEPLPRSDFAYDGLKPKDLIGIPWRVAFALQDAGWYLRSDVVWHKPNPMPESVTDRPTKAHEYVFLLTKAEGYYYDAEAIAEPASSAMIEQMMRAYDGQGVKDYDSAGVQNPSDVKRRIIAGKSGNKERRYGDQVGSPNAHMGRSFPWEGVTRNKRTVWTVTTQPFPGAHFAVMPEKLVEPCILAGSRPGDVVLDPFSGAGTVGAVAVRLGRSFIGTELNPEYVGIARSRIGGVAPLFATETR